MSSINIQAPYSINIANQAIDFTEDNLISWRVSGAVQGKFKIEIKTTVDQSVYSFEQLTNNSSYTIPENTPNLINGQTYTITIQIWATDGVGGFIAGNMAQSTAPFIASKRPVIAIQDVSVVNPNITTTNDIFIVFDYTSDSPLKSWNARLFDANENFIEETGFVQDSTKQHIFFNLRADREYYVDIQAQSVLNLIGISSRIKYLVQPIAVPFSSLTEYKKTDNGIGIELKWTPILVEGEIKNPPPVFIGGNEIDVRDNEVKFSSGFSLINNFYMRFLVRDLPNPTYTIIPNVIVEGLESDPVLNQPKDPLFNQDYFWVDSSTYTNVTSVNIIANSTSSEISTNDLWLETTSVSSATNLQITRDADPPIQSTSRMWLEEFFDRESSVFIRFFDNDDEIELVQYNHLIRMFIKKPNQSIELLQTLSLDYNDYYFIIQKTNGVWSLQGGGSN